MTSLSELDQSFKGFKGFNAFRVFYSIQSLVRILTMAQSDLGDLPPSVKAAIQYQESLFTRGRVSQDDFYQVPSGFTNASPGELLKVEANADVSLYNLPPATALSRILYVSRNLQGSPVPASAYILWPWQPRVQAPEGYPIVAWAHGSSGLYPDAAPSHRKTLFQHWLAPFPLALQGYVVVAPDYVGLGISKTNDGEDIKLQFLANAAAANDVVYAVQAAQQAFAKLSSNFVVIGHSQGGGAAWGVAERQAVTPIKGYLGAIAVSPVTNIFDLPVSDNPLVPLLAVYMVPTMQDLYPDFDPQAFFTEEGWRRYQQDRKIGGCAAVSIMLMTGFQVLRDDWRTNAHLEEYVKSITSGGREIRGPLLVVQGEQDPNVDIKMTTSAIDKTIQAFPHSQLQFVTLPGITHDPVMFASQRLWLDWIRDRFDGVPVQAGYEKLPCSVESLARPVESYQSEANWVIKTAENPIELI